MQIAQVIIDIPTRALDNAFDYLVPASCPVLEVGCPVLVEFGHRPAVGYVVGVGEAAGDLDLGSFKFIKEVLGPPYFDAYAAQTAQWLAHEYVAPLSDAIHLFAPPGGTPRVKKVETAEGVVAGWQMVAPGAGPVDDRWVRITEKGRSFMPPRAAVKQQAVLDALREGEMRVAELSLEVGAVNATIKALEKRGIVQVERRRRIRGSKAPLPPEPERFALTDGQRLAIEAIDQALGKSCGSVVVCDGVTGSGKTEVYLRIIRRVLEVGGSAIVLVPEISLTPQTVARFRARFGETVAVLHSRLSVGERYDQWDLARSGTARVVVGARSALFAPVHGLKLVIIDEEHEGSYKQDSSPRYNARDVAAYMMRLRGGTLVLGSATPHTETLYRCDTGEWTHCQLPERATGSLMPEVHVVDMGREFGAGHRSMFSRLLSSSLHETLGRGEKAVLLLNQRGFASFLLCRECGFVPQCGACSTSLTYHERSSRGQSLQCHHCGAVHPVPVTCPQCGSPYLKKFGAGTQRVHDELAGLIGSDIPIIRMDGDTTKKKGAHEKLLGEFAAAETAVLLGTQMIAKGLDFPEVTLVGVINADTTLNLPDFRAGERTYQLLEQVSGRAGRGTRPGKVVIQTYWPSHPAIRAVEDHDRRLFLQPELAARSELSYPPYARMANLLIWGRDEQLVRKEAAVMGDKIQERLAADGNPWKVLGPSPCVLARLRGVWRWHIVVKAALAADLPGFFATVLKGRKPVEGVSLAVDIDPYDLF